MNKMTLMEKFADPNLIESLSGGDKLLGALITTLMGMGTTFIILVLIWGIIVVMSKILGVHKPASAVAPKASEPVTSAPAAPAPVASAPVAASGGDISGEDPQLVAVITAAIAAAQGSGLKSNLIVRKISRVSGNSPAWRNAGEADCIESRKI